MIILNSILVFVIILVFAYQVYIIRKHDKEMTIDDAVRKICEMNEHHKVICREPDCYVRNVSIRSSYFKNEKIIVIDLL